MLEDAERTAGEVLQVERDLTCERRVKGSALTRAERIFSTT
jgi:hypothetical protein